MKLQVTLEVIEDDKFLVESDQGVLEVLYLALQLVLL